MPAILTGYMLSCIVRSLCVKCLFSYSVPVDKSSAELRGGSQCGATQESTPKPKTYCAELPSYTYVDREDSQSQSSQ